MKRRGASVPEPIGNILEGVLKGLASEERLLFANIYDRWESLVGSRAASHCRPVSVKYGVLLVEVDSPVWRFQIGRGRKREMLKEINGLTGRAFFRDIRFRVGNVSE